MESNVIGNFNSNGNDYGNSLRGSNVGEQYVDLPQELTKTSFGKETEFSFPEITKDGPWNDKKSPKSSDNDVNNSDDSQEMEFVYPSLDDMSMKQLKKFKAKVEEEHLVDNSRGFGR